MSPRHLIIGLPIAVLALLPLVGCFDSSGPVVAQQPPLKAPPAPPPKPKPEEPEQDLPAQPLDRLPARLVIREKAAEGWSNTVYVASPRLGKGDVNKVASAGAYYTSLFWPAILANVQVEKVVGQPATFNLEKIAIGYALPVKDKRVIATRKNPSGAELGLFGGQIFEENEKFLDAATRPVYTPTMQVFDINGIFLRGNEHKFLVLRHVVLVHPKTGQVASVVWLYDPEGKDPVPDKEGQLLPPNYREDRVLNVKGDRIGLLGIPSPDAFAQVQIAQGTPLKFTPALKD